MLPSVLLSNGEVREQPTCEPTGLARTFTSPSLFMRPVVLVRGAQEHGAEHHRKGTKSGDAGRDVGFFVEGKT